MTTAKPTPRWYHLTPDRFVIGLLVVQVFLLLSQRFHWFAFNDRKGWTVLIALGIVGSAVLVMLIWGFVCVLLRRRFQFGVRSLLVLVVVVSIPLGWFAWEMQEARRQREAVGGILAAGGFFARDYQLDEYGQFIEVQPSAPTWLRTVLGEDFFCEVWMGGCQKPEFGDDNVKHVRELTHLRLLYLDLTQITDSSLEHVKEMSELDTLGLGHTQITDRGVGHLKQMKTVERLFLNNTQITDRGLEHVKELTKLEELSLDGTQITDDGLKHLKEMPELRNLHLGDTQITDRGLRHLKGMTRLTRLSLHGTKISDTGLAELKGMTSLQVLKINQTLVTDAGLEHVRELTGIACVWLEGTYVTDQGVQKLQQALPNCDIIR